ncbi:hypothetical protein LCGC14_1731770 [marine sediment metagenome]|uniref:SpoVT-AbrB domain-containing protein n=1 Tax=marine sediment metagenome TaxID=412755 RepID=A0A0F9HX24_9ZZZZ
MQFERKIVKNADVFYMSIPIDLVRHLNIENETILIIQDEKGKKGKYFSVWVKEKGKK